MLSDLAVLDTYQGAIENNLPPLPNNHAEGKEILHHIKSAFNEVSENVFGEKPTNIERDWITLETFIQNTKNKKFASSLVQNQ